MKPPKPHTPLLFLLLYLFISQSIMAQETTIADSTAQAKPLMYHSHKGFEFKTADNKFLLQFAARMQFRYATPSDQDPISFDDFEAGKKNVFKVNRARLKVGGHAFEPWLNYYFEYELSQSNLLNFEVKMEKWKALSFKVGQWKIDYNRERMISSGEQQMIERSIITRPFTIDRQQGVALYGHLAGRGAANMNYWVSVLTGTGRGSRTNDNEDLMYSARLQWNPLGEVVSLSGGDYDRTKKPALLIAVAGATNQSPYTRFSQSGGGQLEGYDDGLPGQYRVKQAVLETAFKWQGFSWQHETHVKEINDHINNKVNNLRGTYLQAGYFLHKTINVIPAPLELAALYAVYRPNIDFPDNRIRELSIAVNYYFSGHKNKLTAQYDNIMFEEARVNQADGNRFRLQWDISF